MVCSHVCRSESYNIILKLQNITFSLLPLLHTPPPPPPKITDTDYAETLPILSPYTINLLKTPHGLATVLTIVNVITNIHQTLLGEEMCTLCLHYFNKL